MVWKHDENGGVDLGGEIVIIICGENIFVLYIKVASIVAAKRSHEQLH